MKICKLMAVFCGLFLLFSCSTPTPDNTYLVVYFAKDGTLGWTVHTSPKFSEHDYLSSYNYISSNRFSGGSNFIIINVIKLDN